jgi:osmotically-inducible protein OsmY
MKKLLATSLITLTLVTGCVPVAMVASATAGGAVIYDNRDATTMNADQNAREYAQRWLDSDPVLKGHSKITVSVFNRVALLAGQAQTVEIRNRAYEIVKRVKNIKRIYNEITIAGSVGTMQEISDSWITTKVRSALLSKSALKSNNIKVVTEGGVVFLMGSISRKQATLAVDAARRVKGVKKVIKVFEYQ